MPGLRYGLDITDDAEMLRKNISAIKRERTRLRRDGRQLSQRRTRELNRYLQAVKAGFGNQKILTEYAKYSRARQGYDPSGRSRVRAGIRERARPAIPNYRALDKRRREASGVSLKEIQGNSGQRIVKLAQQRAKARKAATKTAQRKKAAAKKRANKRRRQKRAATKRAR